MVTKSGLFFRRIRDRILPGVNRVRDNALSSVNINPTDIKARNIPTVSPEVGTSPRDTTGNIVYTNPNTYAGGGGGSSGGGSGGGGSSRNNLPSQNLPQSTMQTPTPSAGEVQQSREAQIAKAEQQQRIDTLVASGARQSAGTYTDVNTGREQQITRYKRGAQTIVEIKDNQGNIRYEEYGTGRAGGGVRLKRITEFTGFFEPTSNVSETKKEEVSQSSQMVFNNLSFVGLSQSIDYNQIGGGASISKSKPGEFYGENKLRLSFGEATGDFFQTSKSNIGSISRGVFLGKDIPKLKDPFESFSYVGQSEGELKTFTPVFGTANIDYPTGFKEQTLFELQRENQIKRGVPKEVVGLSTQAQATFIGQQIARDVSQTYQEKINTGKLTLEDAKSMATEELKERFVKRTEFLSDINKDLTKRSGEIGVDIVKKVGLSAGLIAGGALLPATTFSAANILTATVLESKGKSKQARSFFIAGLASAIVAPGQIAREIDIIRLQELSRQRFKVLGISAQSGDDALGIITARRATESAVQELRIVSPTFRTGITKAGITKFTVGGGRVISTTRLNSFALERDPVLVIDDVFSLTARGSAGLNIKSDFTSFQEKIPKGTFGDLELVKGEQVTRAPFGGVYVTDKNLIKLIGGRGLRLQTDVYDDILRTGIVRPESSGQILNINVDTSTKGLYGFRIGGSKTPFPTGDLTQQVTSQQSQLDSLAGSLSVSKAVIQTIKTPTLTTSPNIILTAPPITTQKQEKLLISTPSVKLNEFQGSVSVQNIIQNISQEQEKITRRSSRTRTRLNLRQNQKQDVDLDLIQDQSQTPKIRQETDLINQPIPVIVPPVSPQISSQTFSGRPGFGLPIIKFPKTVKQFKPRTGKFQVFGRRFGKFELIGVGKTEAQAYGIGRKFVSNTLAATFKVPKGRRLKLPGFKTKKTKTGEILFIEPRRKRLKRQSGEIPEIQTFRGLKGGKKK